MSRRSALLLAIVGICLVQLAIPLGTVLTQERIATRGELVRFRVVPIDPYGPFRGRYIRLNLAPREVEVERGFEASSGDRFWLELRRDIDGFVEAVNLHRNRPAEGLFLPVRIQSVQTVEHGLQGIVKGEPVELERPIVHFQIELERYYLPEDVARRTGAAMGAFRQTDGAELLDVWVEVRILDGNGQVQDLFLDGLPLRAYLRRLDEML